jgi:integrase
MTVAELCDLYLAEGCSTKKPATIATDRGRITRHIKPLLGDRLVRELKRADVERFMIDVANGKTATVVKTCPRGKAVVRGGKGTAARTVGFLGAILAFAVQREIRPDNPARGVKRFRSRSCDRFLSETELARLGQLLSDAEKAGVNRYAIAAIRLLALTGCRKKEILSLKWNWVDLERNVLRLPDSKTGEKTVYLGASATELLKSLDRKDGSPYVFPSNRDDGHFKALQGIWLDLRAKAGLNDVRLHDLRHSFASFAAAEGTSLLIIGKLLGHKNSTTTARYAHLADDPLHRAADLVSKQIAGKLMEF